MCDGDIKPTAAWCLSHHVALPEKMIQHIGDTCGGTLIRRLPTEILPDSLIRHTIEKVSMTALKDSSVGSRSHYWYYGIFGREVCGEYRAGVDGSGGGVCAADMTKKEQLN